MIEELENVSQISGREGGYTEINPWYHINHIISLRPSDAYMRQ